MLMYTYAQHACLYIHHDLKTSLGRGALQGKIKHWSAKPTALSQIQAIPHTGYEVVSRARLLPGRESLENCYTSTCTSACASSVNKLLVYNSSISDSAFGQPFFHCSTLMMGYFSEPTIKFRKKACLKHSLYKWQCMLHTCTVEHAKITTCGLYCVEYFGMCTVPYVCK